MALSVNILIMRDELNRLRSPAESTSDPARSDRYLLNGTPTQFNFAVRNRGPAEPYTRFEEGADVDIRCWISIAAETRRVFCAISTPEYIENWMEISEQSEHVQWIQLGPDDMLCIVRAESVPAIRVCRFRIKKSRNRLKLVWQTIDPSVVQTSTVDVVVRGVPHRCDLWVRHQGICKDSERQFYLAMWRRSLYKLQGLLQ